MSTTTVFVYGSLMRGFGNHRLLAGAMYLGPARTRPEFRMHSLGGFPGMVAGGTQSVMGELYVVDDETTLGELDALEGHPRFYQRTPIVLSDGTHAETYLLPASRVRRLPVVKSGNWRDHDPRVERWTR